VVFRPQNAQICGVDVWQIISGPVLAAGFLASDPALSSIFWGKPIIVDSPGLLPFAKGDVICLRVVPDQLILFASSEVEG
jgi:hypothetical protein